MESKKETIKHIETLIIENKLKDAINQLIPIFAEAGNEAKLNETILILSRLNDFMSKSNMGVVNQFDMEYTKIRVSVLDLKSAAKSLVQSPVNIPVPKVEKKVAVANALLFEEDFIDNKNNWAEGPSTISKREIKNGRYFLEHTREIHCDLYTQDIKIDSKKNFRISTRMTFIEGTEKNGYGICWGKGDNSNYFQFAISSNGHFLYNYFLNNDYFKVSGWIASNAIRKGKQSNLLEIEKKGDSLHFKVNKTEVYTSEFLSFFGDELGFVLNHNMKVAVDFIRVEN